MRRVFPFLCLAIGMFLTFWSIMEVMEARTSSDWPSTKGEITGSTIEEKRRFRSGNQAGPRLTQYRPKISYSYKVEGIVYEAEKVSYGEGAHGRKGMAHQIQSKYPIGRKLDVYFQPEDPKQAVLEPGMNARAWMMPGLGIAFMFFGIIASIRLVKLKPRDL